MTNSERLRAIADAGKLSIRDQAALKMAAAVLDQQVAALAEAGLHKELAQRDAIYARASLSVMRELAAAMLEVTE